MVALGLLVVVVVVVVALGATRLHSHAPAGPAETIAAPDDRLDRWVAAGLIAKEQALAIRAFEHEAAPARPRARISPAVEALAYVGGILLAVGAGMLIARFWQGLGAGGRIGVLGAAATLTAVVGTVVGEADGVTWRLRGFLWALASVGFAATAGLFAYEVLDVSGEPLALAVAGVGGAVSLAFWRLRDRPLQHVLTFLGLAVALGTGIAWVDATDRPGVAIGLALWALGAAWAYLGWGERIPPSALGFLLGVTLTLIASGIVTGQIEALAPVLGLATASGWVALGVVRSERLALVPGVLGIFVFLPWMLGYFFGGTLGAPVVAMVSGAVLLGVVLVLVRRGRDGRSGPGRAHPRVRAYGSAP
jgi:MFS family permease